MPSRALRRLATWIALFAVVAVTFMPSVSRLLAGGRDSVALCSVVPSGSTNPGDPQHALEHCPYCALQADLALPPPAPAQQARAAVRFLAHPPAFLRAPRACAVWSADQARGPPRFA